MKSILDPSFKYVPAIKTDIRVLFERVRKQLREQAERQLTQPANVQPIIARKATK